MLNKPKLLVGKVFIDANPPLMDETSIHCFKYGRETRGSVGWAGLPMPKLQIKPNGGVPGC
jgi:hypothetical protein